MYCVPVGASRRLRWGCLEPRRRRRPARGHQRSRRRAPPRKRARQAHLDPRRSYNPPYAAIVVDANNGAVLHEAAPDAPRHPASLTKIMTLYLLFERLEAGKIALDTPMEVSEEASIQAPTKLGLRPGRHAEGRGRDQGPRHQVGQRRLGGDRRSARPAAKTNSPALMTRKARALGMKQHHLSQRLRPAERRTDHHRARPGAARHRHPGALPEVLPVFFAGELRLSRPRHAQPQPAARQGRRRRRHQDRLHPRLPASTS